MGWILIIMMHSALKIAAASRRCQCFKSLKFKTNQKVTGRCADLLADAHICPNGN